MRKSMITVVLSAFCFCLPACEKTSGKYMRYEDKNLYTAGNAEFSATLLTEVEIDWLGGDIEIEQSADNTLRATEDGDGLAENAKMHYLLDDGVLKIKYCRSGYCGDIAEGSKHLRLEIPRGIGVEIDATTAETTVGVVDVNEFSFESVSGNFSAEKIVCQSMDIETKSGQVNVGELTAAELDAESTDGDMRLGLVSSLQGEIETKSGNITLQLRQNVGLQAKFCTTSGELVTQLPYAKNDGCYTFSQGENGGFVSVKTRSGNLHIE